MAVVTHEALGRGPQITFVDARSGPDARQRYEAKHIEGARLLVLDEDLSAIGPDARHGGRHPFPTPEAFAATLSRIGLQPSDTLVVLDDRDGANAAARLYVMLRAIGHAAVSFLSGGLAALERAGAPMRTGPAPNVQPSAYPAQPWSIPLLSMSEMEDKLKAGATLLDARSGERFRGEVEPFDPVPGHVPGATSLPYASLLDAAQHFLPRDVLRARLEAVVPPGSEGEIIVSCGSGVTACMLMIALEEAGIAAIGDPRVSLWVGSYSEWCRNEKPIARGA